MMNSDSLLSQISLEYGHPDKIRFRNEETVNKLIQQFINNGANNLQVITDFDYTLSKHHTAAKKCTPAADIIRLSPLMSDEFKARSRVRFDKLLPVELDPTLSIEQKTPTVIASFLEGFADIVDSKVVSRKILAQMIDNADDSFQLRDHCETTLQRLHEANIPVLIFSAGFGDLVEGILRKNGIYYPNITVIGNFMEFDDNEQLTGFKQPLIHTFNKNDYVIPGDCYHRLAHRHNVILLGDSIGDATMAEGFKKNGSLLKIGFLNEVNDEQLNIFLETFDIVVLDDQTMDFVNNLLKTIITSP